MKYSMYVAEDEMNYVMSKKVGIIFESYGDKNGAEEKICLRHRLKRQETQKLRDYRFIEKILLMEYKAYGEEHGEEALRDPYFDGIHYGFLERRSDSDENQTKAMMHVVYIASVVNDNGTPRVFFHADEPRKGMPKYTIRPNELMPPMEMTYFVEYRNSEECPVCGKDFCLDSQRDFNEGRCPHCGQAYLIDIYIT